MSRAHTQLNLADVQDAAPAGGFGDRWEARVARVDLEAEQTGVTHFRPQPGKRSPFAHRHGRAEEVYVILAGTGRVKLDGEIADVRTLDAIRIAPEVVVVVRHLETSSRIQPDVARSIQPISAT
jgi:mannose-6-phosphate isomerase-like protein (cupin superfamily)